MSGARSAAGPDDAEDPVRVDGRSRGTAEATRRLLDAAVAEFGEKGYRVATIVDIARRCDLSTGSVYARWPRKHDLFLATFEHVFDQRMVLLIKESGLAAAEKLAMLGSNVLNTHRRETRDLWLEACTVAPREDTLRGPVGELLDAEAGDFSELIAEAAEAGLIDPSLNVDALVFFCQSLGVGSHVMINALASGRDRFSDDDWNQLIARVISALAPPTSN